MKESFWAYFVISFGIVIVVIMLFINNMTTTTEEDFYLARELMQSSMIDAVDYGTYRTTGRLVMSKQKFMEVFLRRFAESVTNNKTYQISFYDIYEEPPKATVRIRTTAGASLKTEAFDVNLDTIQSGILETIYGAGKITAEPNMYTLTYDSNGGTTCFPATVTVEKDKTWGTLCSPTRDNHTFKEWNTKQDGTGSKITSSSIATGSLTVYAQWKKIDTSVTTYTLTYDSNGGSECSPSSITVEKDKAWGTLCSPSKSNYTFKEWNTKKDGKGSKITSTTKATKSLTVYAQWKKIDTSVTTYTLTYDSNGGSKCSPSSITVEKDKAWGTLCSPSKSNYTFKEWNTKKDGKGSKITSTTKATKNLTVYAQWTGSSISFTVKHYKKNAGVSTYTLADTETKSVTIDTTITLANYKKSYTGFSYYGGSTSGGTSGPGSLITTKKISSGNVTINLFYNRAKYKLELEKGTGISAVSGTGTYEYGASVKINAATQSRYQWSGWTKTSGTSPKTFSTRNKSQTIVMGAGDVKLKANATRVYSGCTCGTTGVEWTYHTESCQANKSCTYVCNNYGQAVINADCNTTCTLKYDSKGGSSCGNNTGGCGRKITSLCTPTRNGYRFDGWYTSASGGTKLTSVTLDQDTTIYAHWK